MRIHEKAALYDMLIKEHAELIAEMEKVKEDIENVPNRPDLIEIKESQNYSNYLAGKCGCYAAVAFGIDIKLMKYKGSLKWYKNQE